MSRHHDVLRYTGYQERFRWLTEREKLYGNLEALKRTAEDMSAKTLELCKLFEEVESNLADARSIRANLNRTALKISLPLIATGESESSIFAFGQSGVNHQT